MQFSPSHPSVSLPAQLPLFEAFMAPTVAAPLFARPAAEGAWSGSEHGPFSEVSLRGAAESCLNLLAPMLRELSEETHERWLTLIAPPGALTQAWLRDAGLNRERILLLQPRGHQTALQLACEALRLGKSHTVVTWLNPLNAAARQQLIAAARMGDAESLNVRLG